MISSRPPIVEQYCLFEADGTTWAISAASVREVADPVSIVPVPESPSFLLGVCHFRTEFLPVLDLSALIDQAKKMCHPAEFLLVLDVHEESWALPIQRALRLAPLEIAIRDEADHWNSLSGGVLGMASHEGQVVRVLDVRRLHRIAADVLDASWGAASLTPPIDLLMSDHSRSV